MGRREAFDPLRSFVVNREFKWGGQVLAAGTSFTDLRDMRRVRQLYDNRYLRMSEVDTGAPTFGHMKDAELRQWLVDHGQANLAHPRSTRQRLIERCQRTWVAMQQETTDGVAVGHADSQGGREGVQRQAAAGRDLAPSGRQRERIR